MTALQRQSYFHAARSTRGMLSGIKRWTSSDFLAFEQKAIPLSFNNSFKPLLSYSLLVPVSYVRIFHVFPFLPLPRVSRFLVFKSFAVSFDFWISKCSCYVRFEHQLSYACLNCQGLCPAFSHVSWNGKFFFFFFFFISLLNFRYKQEESHFTLINS